MIDISWLERGTHKPEVSGSIPLPATILDDRYHFAPIVLQWELIMASFRRNNKWEARVRRQGNKAICKTSTNN